MQGVKFLFFLAIHILFCFMGKFLFLEGFNEAPKYFEIQLNLCTTATLGTEESGRYGELGV